MKPTEYLHGDCSICRLPKKLHFSKPQGRGEFLGCFGARAIDAYLTGHGLPRAEDPAEPAPHLTVVGGTHQAVAELHERFGIRK